MTAILEPALHTLPDPEPEQVERFIDAMVAAAFRAESVDHARDPHQLSMSSLGRCVRANAYRLAGTPVDPDRPVEEARPAALGTWIHAGLLPRLVEVFGTAVAEQAVTLHAAGGVQVHPDPGHRVTGSSDLVWMLLLPGGIVLVVVDVKTGDRWKLRHVRRAGPFAEHEMQVDGYCTALVQAGHDVRYAAWLYLERETGQTCTVVKRFTNGDVDRVFAQVARIRGWAATDPGAAPRANAAGARRRGPGLDPECDSCPWLTSCWGPSARRGQVGGQAVVAEEPGGLRAAFELELDAAARESAAKRDRRFAGAVLSGTDVGPYGPYALVERGGGTRDDPWAALRLVEQMGLPVPQMRIRPHREVVLVDKLTAEERARWAGRLAVGEDDVDGGDGAV